MNTPHRTADYSNLDWAETFEAGGVRGALRKVFDFFPNLTPRQKDSRSTLGYAAIM